MKDVVFAGWLLARLNETRKFTRKYNILQVVVTGEFLQRIIVGFKMTNKATCG